MFMFQVVVDDKRLSSALHALAGIAHTVTTPVPVTNAKKGRNGLAAEVTGGANSVQRLAYWLKKHKLKKVRAAQVKQFCQEAGLSTASYGNMITRAKAAGLLKAVKVAGTKGKFEYVVQARGIA
jgi:hypothetical protein